MRQMTTSPHYRADIQAAQMTTSLHADDIFDESLHGWCGALVPLPYTEPIRLTCRYVAQDS